MARNLNAITNFNDDEITEHHFLSLVDSFGANRFSKSCHATVAKKSYNRPRMLTSIASKSVSGLRKILKKIVVFTKGLQLHIFTLITIA